MKILIAPLFALSPMSGPWTRAQRIASAFTAAGHEAILAVAPDGNCRNPVTSRVLAMATPSPLGAPMAIAKRTFPLAAKLGIAGRKPVHSFEEVLWLTGNLAYRYSSESVESLRGFIRQERIDAVYAEFNIHAIIAAKAEGIPLLGSVSLPSQASYACNPEKAKGIRKLVDELGLTHVESSLELFDWLDTRIIPSCPTLEPLSGSKTVFCGFLQEAPESSEQTRNAIVFYMGTGTVPKKALVSSAKELAVNTGLDVYVAGFVEDDARGMSVPANLHLAKFFDFASLLPRTLAFVNHGGQNSVMDGLFYAAPQIIFPGKVFEREYNASSIENAHSGIRLKEFSTVALSGAIKAISEDSQFAKNAHALRVELAGLGGAQRIVQEAETALTASGIEKGASASAPAPIEYGIETMLMQPASFRIRPWRP